MQCPRTATVLKKINVGNVPVYISEACGGVLLENYSLEKFECGKGKRGEALTKHLSQFHAELMNIKERVNCPLCENTVMLRRFYSPLHIVEIDECPGCGAIWLDTGELAKLQSLMLNKQSRAMLRSELLQEHRPINIEGLQNAPGYRIGRGNKIDKLLDFMSFF